MNMKENLETLFEKLENFFRTETVVGKPMNVGDITIIPIIEVSFGLGTGGGSGKDNKGNDGTGGGTGAGGKITPNSVLVIQGDQVSVMVLKDKGSLAKIVEMVPDIVNKIKKDPDTVPGT